MYYLYLDTKIIGAAKQIVSFFASGIFATDTTTVLVKKYKHASHAQICRILATAGIKYRVVNYADLDNLPGGYMFYPFNAQSNCRAVANRRLVHTFITHGESNKAASTKPIVRIYDHIITAGQAGIDRFLSSQILTPYDVQTQKVFSWGNTFIGQTGLVPRQYFMPSGLESRDDLEAVCFYAPTWEGGIACENYTSLAYADKVVPVLVQACQDYQVQHLILRPHPNTGHREKDYFIPFCQALAKACQAQGIKFCLYTSQLKLSWWQKFKLQRAGVQFIESLEYYQAAIAFCDVSAMETQLLNENTPHYVFYRQQDLNVIPPTINREAYLRHVLVFDQEQALTLTPLNATDYKVFAQTQAYLINPRYNAIPLEQRLTHLVAHLDQLTPANLQERKNDA
ncbi:CDP-glycerol glycerophosphotransferase [Psittacicella hinzii]|uniref:CDP-Glycerol:Poly(Glycerophosphate) glycerophosphotransferase n=1 Tax=Psittacicella hinzii TaxID=2028575 RepID=A0A3A1YXK8_9GAMM|nr:CDP-glycerol glycerophosphotransferase [Psittacicella hinzii]RIY40797.1 hypothetical protein CKF58_00115 [Psittacicella hinzii]